MNKRFTAILVATLLVFSTFFFMSSSTSADMTKTYDFKYGFFNKAYEGSDSYQPPADLEIGSELSSDGYDAIAYSDNNRAEYGFLQSDYHRFEFKIFESIGEISEVYVEHEGYGSAGGEPDGLNLFIWNYMTSSWEFLDEHDEGSSDGITSATIITDFYKYIDANGYLNLLAQAKENAGSCPFLYTYNGERYVFVADLYNKGILSVPYYLAMPKDYAKIESSQLQPKDGFYSVQIKQDYDEISYLDQATLITVDHAPDVEIFPSLLGDMFAGRMYTVSKDLSTPISAIDGNGKDILQQVLKKDGIYTSGRQYELNILELNLGDLSGAEQIKLVISAYTNWDNDEVPKSYGEQKPYERFVQVKDENGNWVTVIDTYELMEPAALPRTYVLNLTDKFITNDYSVRIGFYYDVRYDCISVDTSPQREVVINTLTPTYANLHFRGYSNLKGFPATPDYYDFSLNPPSGYSQPVGKFTRFGDVLPLLMDRDDKFVIMHHGDEISVNFEYVPPQEGMERDFMLYSWGYYKNKDFATGGTVEPLPFYGMSSYPYPEGESYPYDDEHIAYLNEYNTREYTESESHSESNEHNTIYTDYVKVEVTFTPPVGGVIVPVNYLELLAPWIALVSAISIVTAIIIIKRLKV